jgi:hypothetical protein
MNLEDLTNLANLADLEDLEDLADPEDLSLERIPQKYRLPIVSEADTYAHR